MTLLHPGVSFTTDFQDKLLLAVLLLLTTIMVANAQQADPDLDVKYSDLYRDLVFEEKGDDWKKNVPADKDPWRENDQELDQKNGWVKGYDAEYQAQQEINYLKQSESRYQYNDPRPTSILRWDFK